jgi:hypothetical protein
MSLTTLLLELVLVAAGSYGLRQQRHWLFVLAVAAGLAGSVVWLARYYVTGGIRWFGPWDLLLVPATIAVVAFALEAHRRKTSWASGARFDRELYSCLAELGAILDEGPIEQEPRVIASWISNAYERGLHVLSTLERMTAPSPEWHDLLAAYIQLTRDTVEAIPSGVTPDQRKRLADQGDALSRRYERIRTGVRQPS